MASRGTFGGYRNIATKSRGSGTSGWNVEREGSCSHGHASTRSAPAIHCQRPGSSTAIPDRTNLSREEPNASIAHVRVCGGRGWKHPRLPGNNMSPGKTSKVKWLLQLRDRQRPTPHSKAACSRRLGPSPQVLRLPKQCGCQKSRQGSKGVLSTPLM